MRIHFGNIPEAENFQPEAEGLKTIRGPKARQGLLLAGLTGFLLLCLLAGQCLLLTTLVKPAAASINTTIRQTSWGAVWITLILYIPLHELLHLVCHPQMGMSPQSTLVIWPVKLQFGVYYEGCMSRTRWLVMRLAPFVMLSMIPACLLAMLYYAPWNPSLRTGLEVLTVVNGVGSGGDVIASLLVLSQVPASAKLCFRSGRAYWKP